MIPNGKEIIIGGHKVVFESEPSSCRGCFFENRDSCPDCDEGIWVEEANTEACMSKYIKVDDLQKYCDNQKDHTITPNDFQRMPQVEIGWHTGTPTEDGDYLVKLDVERNVYPYYVLKWNKNGWYSHYDMVYPACPQHSVLKWQKIEEASNGDGN